MMPAFLAFCMAFTSVQLHTQGQHSDISTQTGLSITDQVQETLILF